MSANYIPNFSAVAVQWIVIMLVWPRMVFWKYLRGKKISYQFAFCLCVMFVLTSIVVLWMGSLNILIGPLYAALFWGAFVVCLAWRCWVFYKEYCMAEEGEAIEIPFISKFVGWWDSFKERLLRKDKNSPNPWFDIVLNIILIVLIVVLVWHMGEAIRVKGAYIFSDTSRHENMINQMLQNDLYKDGVYPYGMHIIMYTAVTSAFANLYNFNMYSGNIMCLCFFVALYFWLRKVFKNKMSAILVIAFFLFVATTVLHFLPNDRMVYDGLHRLRYTLPEEFCMFALFISPICLINIMKSKESMKTPDNISQLILLGLSVATTLASHYYTVIFQFILCLFTFFAYILHLKKEKFIALCISVGAGVLSILIAMGLGFVKCKKWAYAVNWASTVPSGDAHIAEQLASVVPTETGANSSPFTSLWNDAITPFFTKNYLIFFLVLLGIGLLTFVYCCIRRREYVPRFLPVVCSLVVYFVMYAAPALKITRLLESYRLVLILYVMVMTMCFFIVDVLLDVGAELVEAKKSPNSKIDKGNASSKLRN